MNVLGLLLAIACLVLAADARAQSSWWGGRVEIPMAGDDVGEDELGFSVGLTRLRMHNDHVGVGLDLRFHEWPASDGYRAELDRYLRRWYQSLDSPTWTFHTYEVSGHVKFAAPAVVRMAPWIQAGAGVGLVDRRIGAPTWETFGIRVIDSQPARLTALPVWNAGAGLDLHASPTSTVSVCATWRGIVNEGFLGTSVRQAQMPAFTGFTLGVQLLTRAK